MSLSNCTKCPLHETRKKVALPRGDGVAGVMLVGEAPGADEDAAGSPFVGKAGQKLTQHITRYFPKAASDAGPRITEENFWITNIVKCRPPQNRPPTTEEVEACSVWLDKEIARAKPWLIVALGKSSSARFFPGDDWTGRFGGHTGHLRWSSRYNCMVLLTYHPSFIARGSEEGTAAYERHFSWLHGAVHGEHWWLELLRREVIDKKVVRVGTEDGSDLPW